MAIDQNASGSNWMKPTTNRSNKTWPRWGTEKCRKSLRYKRHVRGQRDFSVHLESSLMDYSTVSMVVSCCMLRTYRRLRQRVGPRTNINIRWGCRTTDSGEWRDYKKPFCVCQMMIPDQSVLVATTAIWSTIIVAENHWSFYLRQEKLDSCWKKK